jgi:hypothetical protein
VVDVAIATRPCDMRDKGNILDHASKSWSVVSIHFVNHVGALPGERKLVLTHFGDSKQDIVTWVEVGLNEVSVCVVGLHLLPSLSGDLGGDLFA